LAKGRIRYVGNHAVQKICRVVNGGGDGVTEIRLLSRPKRVLGEACKCNREFHRRNLNELHILNFRRRGERDVGRTMRRLSTRESGLDTVDRDDDPLLLATLVICGIQLNMAIFFLGSCT